MFFFFFSSRRRHTRFSRDWSSDVCSSDLPAGTEASQPATQAQGTGPGSYPAGWEPHTGPVPILEYHAIQPPVAGSSYPQLFVPQDDYQHQMQWLADHGFEAVTLDQVEDAWYEAGELP